MLTAYQAVGAVLVIACLTLTLLSYVFFGLTPLIALWIGLAVVGASMALTPSRGLKPNEVILEMLNTFTYNVNATIESLGLGSSNVYVSKGGDVYIVATLKPIDPRAELDLSTVLKSYGDNVGVVFKSPISRGLVGEVSDVCSSIEYVAVDLLSIASMVECVDVGMRTTAKFIRPKVSSPYRMGRTVGSLYGIITTSIKALAVGRAVLISDSEEGSVRMVVVEGVGSG